MQACITAASFFKRQNKSKVESEVRYEQTKDGFDSPFGSVWSVSKDLRVSHDEVLMWTEKQIKRSEQ